MLVTGFLDDLGRRAAGLWQHAFAVQPVPPVWLVAASGVLALAIVMSARAWPLGRNVVTIVHEGGHALVALVTGQRRIGVRLYRSTAGETVSVGGAGARGAFTAAAGYPAPALLGLGAAALLSARHLTGMLLLSVILLAWLAIAIRNVYGMLAVLVTAGAIAGVCLYGSAAAQAGFGYLMAWFLLLGAVRPVMELQRGRRRNRDERTDADQLARMTRVPGWIWVTVFGLVAVIALAVGASWLIR